jgi:uncharacterized protein YpiB (UPF0302 family)
MRETRIEKGFPTYLIRAVRNIYQNTNIIIGKYRVNDNTPIKIIKAFNKAAVHRQYIAKSSKMDCR